MHFMIHSAVRKRHTRLHRMKAPQHHDLVQRLAGGKFIVRRARPVRISEDDLLKHIDEITKAVEEGRIDIKTHDGRQISLDQLKEAPRPPSKPQYHRRPDSAAHDKPQGFERPMYQEGRGASQKVPLPEVVRPPLLAGDDEKVDEPVDAPAPAAAPGETNWDEDPELTDEDPEMDDLDDDFPEDAADEAGPTDDQADQAEQEKLPAKPKSKKEKKGKKGGGS